MNIFLAILLLVLMDTVSATESSVMEQEEISKLSQTIIIDECVKSNEENKEQLVKEKENEFNKEEAARLEELPLLINQIINQKEDIETIKYFITFFRLMIEEMNVDKQDINKNEC